MKELKIKLKKIWADITWKIRKVIMSKIDNTFLILDLRGNEQVEPFVNLLASTQFDNLINDYGYKTVQWKTSYFRIISDLKLDYCDDQGQYWDEKMVYEYGEELSVIRVYLLGLYTQLDRFLSK